MSAYPVRHQEVGIKKLLGSALLAAALVIGVSAGPASAAAAYEDGVASCEIFQKGGVQSKTEMDTSGWAPGGKTFAYSWGTWVAKTYRINGTKAGGGSWQVNTSGILYTSSTYGYCYGG